MFPSLWSISLTSLIVVVLTLVAPGVNANPTLLGTCWRQRDCVINEQNITGYPIPRSSPVLIGGVCNSFKPLANIKVGKVCASPQCRDCISVLDEMGKMKGCLPGGGADGDVRGIGVGGMEGKTAWVEYCF